MNKIIYGLSRAMAWFGSLVLVLIALMSVASIVGRALSGLGLGPVPGDFELVEAGTALAVFCFLPWAHLKRGHAVVDMLWGSYPAPMRRVLDIVADGLMLVGVGAAGVAHVDRDGRVPPQRRGQLHPADAGVVGLRGLDAAGAGGPGGLCLAAARKPGPGFAAAGIRDGRRRTLMDPIWLATASFPVLLVLIFLRVPIGLSMLVVGLFGSWQVYGSAAPLLNQMKNLAYSQFSSHSLSIVPLFLLMGQFATLGGMSQALFKAAEAFIGHRKGGVGMAAIGACAGFGAICGSSLATAATMGQVALPELKRAGYAGSLSAGALAAGGTLGILIPPSIVLVIYAILAEQNIAKLFAAAFIPGILAALGYMLVINIVVRLNPKLAGSVPPMPWPERWQALGAVWPVIIIFVVVVGGIYTGLFTPTEGAAVGAVSTGVLAWLRGGLTRKKLQEAFESTAGGTAMVFMIVLGAAAYNSFLALSQLPQELAGWVGGQGFSPYVVLWAILVFYLIFGCVMDSLSMILLTIPIFFPMVSGLDFGLTPEETAIWFGILVLIVVEVGLITPPVGMNLFVIQSMAPDISIRDTYRGVWPFVLSDLLRVVLLVLVPGITLLVLRL